MESVSKKKIVLAAGTGQLGKALCRNLYHDFDEFVILTRDKEYSSGKLKFVHWDAKHGGSWQKELEDAVAIINLTGKNVNCRYTKKNKAEILNSRIDATTIIGKTIKSLKSPPEIWINLASSTIFRHSEDKRMTEADTHEYGEGFSVNVCKAWEKAFFSFSLPSTRQVCLRVGMALGNDGGVFPVLKKLVRSYLGGTMGNGRQMISWIDDADFCSMMKWAIENKNVNGIYNCTSPYPISNKEFMKLLRQQLNVPFGLPANRLLLEIGSFVIRTETELVLKSRNVIPAKAALEGFVFAYPKAEESIKHLLNQ